MKKRTVAAVICFVFCAGFILCSGNPVQAGKYIYFNEKGEEVAFLPKKQVQRNTGRKDKKAGKALDAVETRKGVGAPLMVRDDAPKKNIKK